MLNNQYLKILLILYTVCLFKINSLAQDSLRIDYNYINSVPQNAEVFLNDKHIGQTPARFMKESVDTMGKVTVTLKLKGYLDYSFTVSTSEMPVNKTINLVPRNNLSLKEENKIEENTVDYFKTPRKIAPIVVSSIVSGGSAVLSYYFKKLADENYDEYLATGNRDKFNKTRQYDIYSGVFLAAFQISFAALIYFLLID